MKPFTKAEAVTSTVVLLLVLVAGLTFTVWDAKIECNRIINNTGGLN